MVERRLRMAEVKSSNLLGSTILTKILFFFALLRNDH